MRIALLIGLVLNLALQVAHAADDDPSKAPIPDISDVLLDTRRAIYVEFSILTDGTVQLLESGVTNVPPTATDEEPALLLIEVLDADGQLLGTQNAWDPRYQLYVPDLDDQDELFVVEEGIGVFLVPFDHSIARFRISDQQQDPVALLADIDVQALVEGFCTNYPSDDNCEGFDSGDADGDGIVDGDDNCPNVANPDQADIDADSIGDACDPDDDNDGISDPEDNCPAVSNVSQDDFDADSTGDACDDDVDGDGVANASDACTFTNPGEIINPDGCAIGQLCPCEGPYGDNDVWRNTGKYVSCYARVAEQFVELGLISESEKDALQSAAARSGCGLKR